MKLRINLFYKMLFIIVVIISITLFLYGRSYQNNIKLITNQLTLTDLSQLNFFTQQLDNNVDQLFTNAYTLFRDSTIRNFGQIDNLEHLINRNNTKLNVLEKLSLQTSSANLINHIAVYNVNSKEVLSTDSTSQFGELALKQSLDSDWTFIPYTAQSMSQGEFHMYLASPAHYLEKPEKANMIMEVRFSTSELVKMLSEYQTQYSGDTFLFQQNNEIISQPNSDLDLARGILSKIEGLEDKKNISTVVNFEGKRYMVNSAWSESLKWHVIHYSPLEIFLKPLESSRLAFYIASIFLLILSIFLLLLLFRQIHRPISMLIRAVNRIKEGMWSYRINLHTNNEFSILNEAFNEMASQIQTLIEQVYMEQLRVKDAYLKQLQSQINPHFLYNCLFFIKSKAGVGDTDAVSAMAINLGEYYRYITRLDESNTTIGQELKLLDNYLSVQNLRKQRIVYQINMPESLLELQIPRLLIQPLVENSIVHGIEKISGQGLITITGKTEGTRLYISVEDNGAGMSEQDRIKLLEKIESPVFNETSGYGLWNVQQRLKHVFGVHSGLSLSTSEMGGVCVTLRMDRKEV